LTKKTTKNKLLFFLCLIWSMVSTNTYEKLTLKLNCLQIQLGEAYKKGVINERQAILTLIETIIDNHQEHESWTVLLRQARDAITNRTI
jgi:hypothetical protein